ncbi:hypothetical protein GP486_003436 [Trichoglossum hirsutum]|uniref:SET domain-containing protein n=1 Tax=Trichoglossum hirsutum TaxID=265104 RepID=A0A9P8LD96_9PEZI|nr:hypothetical protein GP486_003436 [Trichoglossum hirsutum]
MRQTQTQLGRDVIDLTLDSDSDDAGPRNPPPLRGQTASGRTTNMNSRRPNAIGALDANLAGESRRAPVVLSKPPVGGLGESVGIRTPLTNGSAPTTTSSQQGSLDRWLSASTAHFKAPVAPADNAAAMDLDHSQDSETARSSGRRRKINSKYMHGDWEGLSPTLRMVQGIQKDDLEIIERSPQPSNDVNVRRTGASELHSALVSTRRQRSPTPMRLNMQTPMRISTGGRFRNSLIGDSGYLTGFGGSVDPPRTTTRSLSPVEMTSLLKKYLAEIADDHDYFVTAMLRCDNMKPGKFTAKCGRHYCAPAEHFEAESPIKEMKAVQFPSMPKGLYDATKYAKMSGLVRRNSGHYCWGKLTSQIWKNHNTKAVEVRMTAPLTRHTSDSEPVPKYSSYTSLRRNVLAEDDDKLRYFPYFGDDINDGGALQELYSDWTKNLPTVHRRSEQAAMLVGTAEKFLAETGLSFYDAVHYLIGNIETIAPHATSAEELEQAKRERRKSALYNDFELEPAKQKLYLDSIPPPTSAGLAIAPAICKAWKDATSISLWDVIKRGDVSANPGKQNQNTPTALPLKAASGYYSIGTVYSMKCLICFAAASTDDVRAITPEANPTDARIQPQQKEASAGEKRKRPSRLLDRDDIGNTSLHSERTNFRPCNHEWPCAKGSRCDCVENEVVCEKTCRCPPECPRRWRGCSCLKGGAKVCSTQSCECYKMNRECDPDLCGSCGAIEVLDPVNRYDDEICYRKCTNVALQRDRPKRTLIGASKLAGYGLFMGEPAKIGEFLGEYKGELISNDEAERRGVVYDVRGFSYLFNVNEDANRAGNKFRFVNHSRLGENCAPRVVFANGVHRIGMYARRDLVVGEELYFNYNYGGKSLKFVQKEIDMPVVPQTARPRSHKTGGSSNPKAGKRNGKKGGARPGAGRKPNNGSSLQGVGVANDGGRGGNEELDLYEFDATGAKSNLGVVELDEAYAEISQCERNPEEEDDAGLPKRRDRNGLKRQRNETRGR